MAVYVDDMYRSPLGRLGRMKMSHMYADTERELRDMADLLGLRREWEQNPGRGRHRAHYDVSMAKRAEAIRRGAVPVTMRELARIVSRWRREANG